MHGRVAFRVLISLATVTLSLVVHRQARAEHCWDYVDGVNPVTGQVVFPGFEFTKAPMQCVQQGDQNSGPNCSWFPGQSPDCTVGGTCCTSIPEPGAQQSILSMHSEWHQCFGNTGGPTPFPGRSARWLAFHRQFDFDFDLMRDGFSSCGPGKCVINAGVGTCNNGHREPCTTDDQCSAHRGCFIEALDWRQNMVFPYGSFGADYPRQGSCNTTTGRCAENNTRTCTTNADCVYTHPTSCGTGPIRPDNLVCTGCRPLPACLYNAGAGPLNGDPPERSTLTSCLGWQGGTCDRFCGGDPSFSSCRTDADCGHVSLPCRSVCNGNPATSCTTDADCPVGSCAPGFCENTTTFCNASTPCAGGAACLNVCNGNPMRFCATDADCGLVPLNKLPSLEVVAQILDNTHHARFHGEVGFPLEKECQDTADCVADAMAANTSPRCDPNDPNLAKYCPTCQGTCVYNLDVMDPACSPRDPMFWRLHKRLDDTVRAWQQTHPIDFSVVIDRSGSMSETDISGVPKIRVVTEALRMLADLVPDGQSDRVGVVSYATDAGPDMPLTPGPNARTAIQAVASGIEARVGGCTGIGNGLEKAIGQICPTGISNDQGPSLNKPSCHPDHNRQPLASGANERKGILLLTDGLENRSPCLRSIGANPTPTCGGECGGEPFDYKLLGPNTQLCAIGFGQAQSVNGNLLTLVAERQGGIYMQSPAKGPNDQDGTSGQGRWVDIKDFFVKCFGQLSSEFVGIDPKGSMPADEYATVPTTYDTCDDERLTFIGGWNSPDSTIRVMVNTPSGMLVRRSPADLQIESSAQGTWGFTRVPLPFRGEQGGAWKAQIIRQHNSYVNGFTTDALPNDVAVSMVRKQIQRICPDGCASVLYFEDGHLGTRSAYEDALAAEQASGLLPSVTRATDANDFNTRLDAQTWSLVVYAHQLTEGPEPYDQKFVNEVCLSGQRVILTDTRVGDLTSTPAPGDPNFLPYRLNSCAGGLPFGAVNFNQITGDFRLLNGTHTLTNNGYARFSYGQRPFTLGGPTQATASTAVGTVGAISANGGTPCDGEFCGVPTQNWFVNVLVRGNSQLDDAPTQFTYKTGVSGLLASARVLPANIPLGGYDVADVRLDLERPTVGVGRTLINIGQQPPGGTSTADGADGRSAALAKATRIPTVIQSFGLNDDGIDGDQEVKNAYWSRRIPDTDTPGTCLVDGMYKMHFTANFTKNGCTKRRELVRSTFVDVGVDATASGVTITPQTNAMRVNFCPKDRCGNQSGWGRQITCGPTPGCSCAASDIVDHGDGCYTVTVHTTPNASECTIDGTGSPIDVKTPVTASAGPDQILQCAGNGATAQLDGSGSSAASGTLSFLWTAPGITFSNPAIARPTARFPVGTTTVTLTVTSSTGGSATDNVLITVIDTAAPVIQVPPDITISTCVNANIGTATALDGCQGAVTVTNNRPTKFPLGTTVVTYFAVDRFGNASSATQRVTAVLGDDTSCCPTGTTIRVGTSNNDTLNGTSGSDCILGRGAQDTINGLGGNDFISGGEGNDIIDGGNGNDQLFGGNGQDQLRGGIGSDILDGGGGDDQCFGGDNDDVVQGGQGQDQLFGENGNDQLFGNDGDDRLEGGAGNDALNGGGLHDVCIGGPGTDTFALCQTATQ